MKKKIVTILAFAVLTVAGVAGHMSFKNLRLDQNCYVDDNGIKYKSTEPILLGEDLHCDSQIQIIQVDGDIDIIAFSRERGFVYPESGIVEVNGFVPCIFINKESIVGTGEIHIIQENGIQNDYRVIPEGETIVVSKVR